VVASGQKKGLIHTFWKCPWVNKKKKKDGGKQNWGCGCLREKKKKKRKHLES
jgi:hypothetical protein